MASYKRKNRLIPSDFCIRYNPFLGEGEREIVERLLYTLVIKRVRADKPTVWFIGGDSGEGKSSTALTIQDILCNSMGIDLYDVLEYMNIMHPMEYADKLKDLLFSKDKVVKKLRFFCMHEARTIVNAGDWNTKLSKMIANVNAMSRAIKPLCMIIISQFIKDITKTVRYTLTYYSTISRPLNKPYANLRIFKLYKDDRDLEKPKIKKRFLQGYFMRAKIENPNPMNEAHWDREWKILKDIKLHKTRKEVYDKFKDLDVLGKKDQMVKEMDEMSERFKIEAGGENNRIDKVAEHYTQDLQSLSSVSKKVRGQWKINLKVRDMHNLNKKDTVILESKINEIVSKKDWDKNILEGHGANIENE